MPPTISLPYYLNGPNQSDYSDGSSCNSDNSLNSMDGQGVVILSQFDITVISPGNIGGQNSSSNQWSDGPGSSSAIMDRAHLCANHGVGTVYRVCIECAFGQFLTTITQLF
jgi:hypothetical protein